MREPTKSERTLMLLLGGIFVALLLLFAWQALQKKLQEHRKEEAELRKQLADMQPWIGQEPLWVERRTWLQENPPEQWHRETSEADLVQQLQTSLAAQGLDILNQRLIGAQDLAGFREIAVQITLRGTTEKIVRWLHEVQQPGEFVAIRQFNLRADADKANLRAEVFLVRHYQELDGTPTFEPLPDGETPGDQSADTTTESILDAPAAQPSPSAQNIQTSSSSIAPKKPTPPNAAKNLPKVERFDENLDIDERAVIEETPVIPNISPEPLPEPENSQPISLDVVSPNISPADSAPKPNIVLPLNSDPDE